MIKKKWFFIGACAILLVGGGIAMLAGSGGAANDESLPFRLGEVQLEDLQVSVREVGTVEPLKKVDVKSMVSGKVVSLRVKEGAYVKAGDLLAEVEPDVEQAQTLSNVKGELQREYVSYLSAEREFLQNEAMFKEGLISEFDYLNAKTARDLKEEAYKTAQTRHQIVESRGIPISGNASTQIARITSPMDGVVIKKGVELGESITSGVSSFNAGSIIYTVADLKSLIVKVNLNEVDVAKVKVGQSVRVTLDAYPQKIFTGKVGFVSPAAKILERIKVFDVEIQIKELSEVFRTGMSANVELLGEKRTQAPSIAVEALQKKDGQVVVYRLKKDIDSSDIARAREGLNGRSKFVWLSENWKDFFEMVPVKAGIDTLERVEILSGLSAGDVISLEDPTRKKVEKDEDL